MHLLVTGGAGFIGSHFVEMGVQAGHTIIVLDALTYAGHEENLSPISGPGSFKLIVGDICDHTLLTKLFRENSFDAIINFVAESHVDRSIAAPSPFIQTNIMGTFRLLNAALAYWEMLSEEKQKKFRFLQVSTDEVFGSLSSAGKFNEKTPLAPNSPYSASKAAGDLLVRAWNQTYNLPTLITHCSNNYGPRQFPEKLIPLMIHHAMTHKPLPVYGDGRHVRDWIHVEDHCRGIFLALEKGIPGSQYCFGGNAERNNLELVKTLCRHLDVLKPLSNNRKYEEMIEFVKDRRGHDRRYAIDSRRVEHELDFTRHYTFEMGLKQTIEWYLQNEKWIRTVLANAEKRKA